MSVMNWTTRAYQTLTKMLDSGGNLDINEGSLDGVTIGADTPGAGSFTTLNAGTMTIATLAYTDSVHATTLDVNATANFDGRVILNVATQGFLVPSLNNAASPVIAFGDGDTGFYEISDDTLGVAVGAVEKARFTPSYNTFVGSTQLGTTGIGMAPTAGNILTLSGDALINGYLELNGASNAAIYPTTFGPTGGAGLQISDLNHSLGARGLHGQFFYAEGDSWQNTSGDTFAVNLNTGFSATTGTGIFESLLIDPIINQTGGTGISRGIYINPTLTNAVDWRSLEVAAGKSVFKTITASDLTATDLSVTTVASVTPAGGLRANAPNFTRGSYITLGAGLAIAWGETMWRTAASVASAIASIEDAVAAIVSNASPDPGCMYLNQSATIGIGGCWVRGANAASWHLA